MFLRGDFVRHYRYRARPPVPASAMECQNPGLGHLSRLPFEVRRLIWSNFLNKCNMIKCNRDTFGIDPCAILVLSHQIYEELAALIYNGRSLKFATVPDSPRSSEEHPGRATVVVHTHKDCIRDFYPSYLTLASSSLPNLRTRALANLPYWRLKSIEIEIGAPNPADAGELVREWSKVVWIVNLLQQADKLPSIEINAIETPGRCWHTGENLHKSIEGPNSYDNQTDLELLLMLFRNLRNVQRVNVQIPVMPKHGGVDTVIKTIEVKTASNLAFGTQFDEDDGANDLILASEEDTWSVWLDHVLDDLQGHAAAMCRLERFTQWCDEYQADVLARIWDTGSIGGVFMEKDQTRQMEEGFYERRKAVFAFNPMAYDERRHFDSFDEDDLYTCDPNTYWKRYYSTEDDWCPYTWYEEYGKDGIPRKSSPEYQNRMLQLSQKMEESGLTDRDYQYKRPWYRRSSKRYRRLMGRWKTRDGKWVYEGAVGTISSLRTTHSADSDFDSDAGAGSDTDEE